MRLLRRILIILALVIVVLVLVAMGGATLFLRRSFPTVNGTIPVEGLKASVEIYRDRWGVPHIYAQNTEDLFFAQGYVHAQDRLWQMEFQRRIGHGTLSEVLGETTLETDRFLRTIGLARAAQADLALLDDETRLILETYARGVNAFIETHQGNLPLEFTLLGFKPAPWQPIDTVAWGKVMAWDLGGNWETELLRARLIQALGEEKTQELLPPYPDQGPFIVPPEVKSYARLGQPSLKTYARVEALLGLGGPGVGSNNWVVDGAKSATGKPLLANDPHLGIQMPSIWYEIGLHGGGLNVVGASFPGAPAVIIGHNDRLAWGVTNLPADVQDLYIEKVNPANPNQVEFQGRWEDVEVVREEIRVKGRGSPEVLEVRITRHGPLINEVVEGLEQPLAFKWTATAEPNRLFHSVLALNRARDWEEFRDALHNWAVPSQNFVYADVEGNIGYQTPGLIPIRASGQGLVPVPGWTGEYEWTGYIPFEELPSVYNPPTHFIATANNKVVPDDYPYFLSYEWEAPYRAQRIVDLLTAKERLSVEDFQALQADVYDRPSEWLSRYLQQLEPQGWLQERAMEPLRAWDLRTTADSVAAAIYQVTYLKLIENTFGDELGGELFEEYLGAENLHHMALARIMEDADNPWFDDVTTPQRETRDDILGQSFAQALDFLGNRFGDEPPKWSWGRLHTATFDHPLGSVQPLDRIFNRGPIPVDGYGFTVNNTGFSHQEPFAIEMVASYRQIVDLGDLTNSLSMHTTGQSGQPFHKHYGDMIPRWQAVEYHPMLWEEEAVAASKEGLLVLTPR
jgi:penicillin amidase